MKKCRVTRGERLTRHFMRQASGRIHPRRWGHPQSGSARGSLAEAISVTAATATAAAATTARLAAHAALEQTSPVPRLIAAGPAFLPALLGDRHLVAVLHAHLLGHADLDLLLDR